MNKVEYLEVQMDAFKDSSELSLKLSKLKGFEFKKYTPEKKVGVEGFRKNLLEIGLTETFYAEEYKNAIGTINKRPDDIKEILQKYLDKIITSNKLLIIDQYIFPNYADNGYSIFLGEILDRYIVRLDEIRFITSSNRGKYSLENEKAILTSLINKKPSLKIIVGVTENFHDRFWISDYKSKGMFLGTSLNGFGKKYALIDYLNAYDVREIISALEIEGLLS